MVTNSTYDGLCYDVNKVVMELSKSVPRIHFDEAWYAYAKFHEIYHGRFAMGVPDDMPDRPTIFAVQSTHKMLAAFSMASMVHVKLSPRAPLDFDQFNESFMMHGTTSPFYPLIASLDVAAAMMDEPAGPTLMSETLQDAISFRKAMSSIAHRLRAAEQGWFFRLYQPEYVFDPLDGKTYLLEEAADGLLTNRSSAWTLKTGEEWHGYQDEDIADDYCMLDPTKVTILTPGVNSQGVVSDWGIPAAILNGVPRWPPRRDRPEPATIQSSSSSRSAPRRANGVRCLKISSSSSAFTTRKPRSKRRCLNLSRNFLHVIAT